MSANIAYLNKPYRSVVDLSDGDGIAVIPKTGDRLKGGFVIDQSGDDIVLTFADGHGVTLANV